MIGLAWVPTSSTTGTASRSRSTGSRRGGRPPRRVLRPRRREDEVVSRGVPLACAMRRRRPRRRCDACCRTSIRRPSATSRDGKLEVRGDVDRCAGRSRRPPLRGRPRARHLRVPTSVAASRSRRRDAPSSTPPGRSPGSASRATGSGACTDSIPTRSRRGLVRARRALFRRDPRRLVPRLRPAGARSLRLRGRARRDRRAGLVRPDPDLTPDQR